MRGQDPNKVAVWQLEFKFATHKIKNGRGTHFLKALDNEPYDQLYERFFMEVDGQMRNVHGDYQFTGCRIRPAIMRDDLPS